MGLRLEAQRVGLATLPALLEAAKGTCVMGLFGGRRREDRTGLGSAPERVPADVPLDETTPTVHFEGGDEIPGTYGEAEMAP